MIRLSYAGTGRGATVRANFTAAILSLLWTLATGCLCTATKDLPHMTWTEVSSRSGGAKGAVQLRSGEILATRTEWKSNAVWVVCSRSMDGGTNWQDLSVITSGMRGEDIGDGHLLELSDGSVLFGYRHNQHAGARQGRRQYSIKTATSRDAGKTWGPHSIVAQSSHDAAAEPEALRGLWSCFLLLRRDGALQCYYDDEDTPHREGFFRHQWVTMKTWDSSGRRWHQPVTVSRAHARGHLSRDGMASVVELPSGRLLCAFESVQTYPPHANCIRMVTSDNSGRTWSWQREEREILFQSSRANHLAVSPWLARLPGGELVCVFATDENSALPGKSGTHPRHLELDLKYVLSKDSGRTWSHEALTLYAETHRTYVPGVLPLRDGALLVTCEDFATGGYRAFRGTLAP